MGSFLISCCSSSLVKAFFPCSPVSIPLVLLASLCVFEYLAKDASVPNSKGSLALRCIDDRGLRIIRTGESILDCTSAPMDWKMIRSGIVISFGIVNNYSQRELH